MGLSWFRSECRSLFLDSSASAVVMFRRAMAGVGGIAAAHFVSMEQSDAHSFESAIKQYSIWQVLKLVGWQARRRHDRECDSFADTQKKLLAKILEENACTAYGSAHDFGSLCKAEDPVGAFRASHPITEYPHWRPWVDRIAEGETNVLLKEPETMLAATSGTSGQRALLPYNQTM